MATRNRLRFVRGQVGWMVTTVVVLSLFEALTLKLFFVVSLVGFLALVELTAPVNVTPRWRARLRWLLLLGLLGFAYIVVRRLLAFFPAELL